MGLLRGTKCYLAGPIEYADDSKGGVVWRNEITPILRRMGIRVYDPMVKPLWYPAIAKTNPSLYVKQVISATDDNQVKEAFDAVKFIERADFRYIYDCEWVIVYLPRTFTAGTFDELRVAVDAGKPIFVISPDIIPSSWCMSIVSTADTWKEVFYKTMDQCVKRVEAIDRGEVALDPLRWIFLSYFNESLRLTDPGTWAK